MKDELYNMLKSSADADVAKAKLTLNLLSSHAVGIGDHSLKIFMKMQKKHCLYLLMLMID